MESNDKKPSIHSGHRNRLRDLIYKTGVDNISNYQLLEFILTFSNSQGDTNVKAHNLLSKFKTVANVLDADISELIKVEGIGESTAKTLKILKELLIYYAQERAGIKGKNYKITKPQDCKDFFALNLFGKAKEELFIAGLNTKNEVIKFEQIGKGGTKTIHFELADIGKFITSNKIASIIIGHCHPGGEAYPSIEDINGTEEIFNLCTILNVDLYDHIIVGENEVFSFKEMLSFDVFKKNKKTEYEDNKFKDPSNKLKFVEFLQSHFEINKATETITDLLKKTHKNK